ncbi:MAG TPA: hypothetical protein VMT62_11505 [Syntrophorhabdaceae bacterium]|nr:hypothetical protein [Syntrophorhabdaceae bacterium]
METTAIITQGNVAKVPYYGSRPIAETSRPNREKQDGAPKGSVAADAARDDKGLARAGETRVTNGSTSLLPVERFLTPEGTGNSSYGTEVCPARVATGIKIGYTLNVDTQFVKDQYAIDKVVTGMIQSGVSRYREVEAAGLRLMSTLEVYA